MPPISFQDLPLNIYMVIFGTGIFVFMLSLIFCCYFIRWVARWLTWGPGEGEVQGVAAVGRVNRVSLLLLSHQPPAGAPCFEDKT